MPALCWVQLCIVKGFWKELVDEGTEGHAAAPAGGEVLDVHVLRLAGREQKTLATLGWRPWSLPLPPFGIRTLRFSIILLPWGGKVSPVPSVSPACAHLVVSRHGPAPLQKHVLNTTNGCPGCLCVPEQCSGARGCPVKEGARYFRSLWGISASRCRVWP